jgi:putative membrane protein
LQDPRHERHADASPRHSARHLAALYAAGVWRIHRSGARWPVSRTLLFVVAGLGSWAVVSFGFLGSYSEELR